MQKLRDLFFLLMEHSLQVNIIGETDPSLRMFFLTRRRPRNRACTWFELATRIAQAVEHTLCVNGMPNEG